MDDSGARSRSAGDLMFGKDERIKEKNAPPHHNSSCSEIPTRSLENALPTSDGVSDGYASSPGSMRACLPPRPSTALAKSSMKKLLPQWSSKTKSTMAQEGDKSISKLFSLPRAFSTFSGKRTLSLPTTPVGDLGLITTPDGGHETDLPNSEIQGVQPHRRRSFSVPGHVRARTWGQMQSVSIPIISLKPRPAAVDNNRENGGTGASEQKGEDISEEEAVCRICMVELEESVDTLKMECSCRGELALAHKECAVTWFSIKGNLTCDICKQEVKNIPVALLRTRNPQAANGRPNAFQQSEFGHYRVWQDVPVLVMVSMLAYFCFLEQLLIADMGSRALAISLPFSCILGLLSTMLASTMASKSYIWAYASFQFATVILFAHILYNLLRVASLLSVLLSSFAGFGVAISTNSLIAECWRWRERRRNPESAQEQQHEEEGQERPGGGSGGSGGDLEAGNLDRRYDGQQEETRNQFQNSA